MHEARISYDKIASQRTRVREEITNASARGIGLERENPRTSVARA
jgi:hypothetical protein